MTSTFFGLEMMKKALFAQQTALNTVGHNISNANTPGYSRQRVNMSASQPMYYPSMTSSGQVGQLGTGVDVQSVTRLRESFLDAQYRNQNQLLGEWEVKSDTVQKLEAIFNEPSDTGLTATLTQFFDAWQSLSTDPTDSSARAIVLQRANQLADLLRQDATQLSDLRDDITNNISVKIDEFNSYIDQIQKINEQINTAEVMHANANDLRDKRDLLVDQLSKIAAITATESQNANGTTTFKISLNGNDILVDQGTTVWNHLSYQSGNFILHDQITNTDGGSIAIPSGQLKGMADSLSSYVGQYQTMLDDFANSIITVVNSQHALGYTPLGSPGGNVFSGSNASDIQVQLTATDQIASSDSPSENNGNNAISIAELANSKHTIGSISNVTFEGYIQALVGKLGVQGQEADQFQKNQSALVDQMDNMRQSVSGVSIDEEMADMIKYQQAYSAAARMVTTIDTILDKIINGMGITR